MKTYILAFLAVVSGLHAQSIQTGPKPLFSAKEAIELSDKYVTKTFPDFPDIYCAQITYEDPTASCLRIEPPILWRMRYILPNNPAKPVPGSPYPDTGVCLIYVHPDKSVTHTLPPKRNVLPSN